MKVLNISQFRNNISKLVAKVSEDKEVLVLLVNGQPQVVVITVDEYNRLMGEEVISTDI